VNPGEPCIYVGQGDHSGAVYVLLIAVGKATIVSRRDFRPRPITHAVINRMNELTVNWGSHGPNIAVLSTKREQAALDASHLLQTSGSTDTVIEVEEFDAEPPAQRDQIQESSANPRHSTRVKPKVDYEMLHNYGTRGKVNFTHSDLDPQRDQKAKIVELKAIDEYDVLQVFHTAEIDSLYRQSTQIIATRMDEVDKADANGNYDKTKSRL
jgi:hypothetical protein